MNENNLLEIQNLNISFKNGKDAAIKIVSDVSFSIAHGETVGIVGESGCGKSLTCASLMGILPDSSIVSTSSFSFLDYKNSTIDEIKKLRGKEINMIFQNALSALNPCLTIEQHFSEYLKVHTKLTKNEIKKETLEILTKVGISECEKRLKSYPHELSGGMCQRIMIALAIISRPKLLIADEPTTALDVSIQAQIVLLLKKLQTEFNMSLIFVSHNLSLISQICDRIIVMYSGEIIEMGSSYNIINFPKHPYTKGLLDSLPEKQFINNKDFKANKLPTIPGIVPDFKHKPSGCIFHDRCNKSNEKCTNKHPELVETSERSFRCYYPNEYEVI